MIVTIARLADGSSRRSIILLAALFAVLLIAPWFVTDYLVTVLILILYLAYAGQAWNIMMGFAGQLSLGHAIYAGLADIYIPSARLGEIRNALSFVPAPAAFSAASSSARTTVVPIARIGLRRSRAFMIASAAPVESS